MQAEQWLGYTQGIRPSWSGVGTRNWVCPKCHVKFQFILYIFVSSLFYNLYKTSLYSEKKENIICFFLTIFYFNFTIKQKTKT